VDNSRTALFFQRRADKNEGKSRIFGYHFVDDKIQPKERRLAMNKRNKLDFSGQPVYIGWMCTRRVGA